MSENYLQRAWSDAIDNVKIDDVKIAISETLEMDDEHGAFWVSIIINDENILEMNKNFEIIGVFEDNNDVQFKKKFESIEEIIALYEIFLNEDFNKVKSILR